MSEASVQRSPAVADQARSRGWNHGLISERRSCDVAPASVDGGEVACLRLYVTRSAMTLTEINRLA